MIFLFFCTEMAFHSKGSLAGILNSLHLMLLTHMMKCLLLGVDQTRYKEIFEIHNFQLFAFVVWTSAKYSNRFEYGLQMKLNDMRHSVLRKYFPNKSKSSLRFLFEYSDSYLPLLLCKVKNTCYQWQNSLNDLYF